MKITKYNQSCLLVETCNKRILIDPGCIGYDEELLDEWKEINYILITHRHSDHCNSDAINHIAKRDNAEVYTSQEVLNHVQLLNSHIVKAGDKLNLEGIKIEVTKAIHGFLTAMKSNGNEIYENIGFILDDGDVKLYHTSDTINFNNGYKCDILSMPFNGNGLTLGIIDGCEFAKDINPKIVLPVHMEHPNPIMNPNVEYLEAELKKQDLNYKILKLRERIQVTN